jgi:hypothetical protein
MDEGKSGFDHSLHVQNVPQQPLLQLLVADFLGAQPHPGQHRAVVVADRRQHAGAVGDEPLQAFLHPVEGLGGPADFVGSVLGHGLGAALASQAVGRVGQPAERPGDPA